MSISKTADGGLRTARLVLRPARAGDAADLHGVFGDAETMRYWSTGPDGNVSVTQARVDAMIAEATDPLIYFIIEKDGRAIGTVGAHHSNEVGFILHRAHQRQGLVREAMGAIIPYLFSVVPHDRLTADVDPRNTASVKLLESFGFMQTHTAAHTFCVNGEWADSVYLALARPIACA